MDPVVKFETESETRKTCSINIRVVLFLIPWKYTNPVKLNTFISMEYHQNFSGPVVPHQNFSGPVVPHPPHRWSLPVWRLLRPRCVRDTVRTCSGPAAWQSAAPACPRSVSLVAPGSYFCYFFSFFLFCWKALLIIVLCMILIAVSVFH